MQPHIIRQSTADHLHEDLLEDMLFSPRKDYDDANSVDVQKHNLIAMADSFEWNQNIARFWTTRNRWNTMVKQYIDPEALVAWLDQISGRFPSSKRGIAVLRTNTVKARNTGRGVTRRWGSCMLSLSLRVKPWPQITLHSRTCYLGYLSVLDLTVAHVCARLAGARVGIEPSDMRFVWQLEMAQYHGFRCIAYPLGGSDELYERFTTGEYDPSTTPAKSDYPGLHIARGWHDRILDLDEAGVPYGDMPFSSFRRVRARWHTQVYGYDYALQFAGGARTTHAKAMRPIPDTWTDDLDFSVIGVTR
jgi:hypothetical protein